MKSSSEPASDLVVAPKVTDRLQSYRSPEPASDLVIAPKVTDIGIILQHLDSFDST